MYRIGIVVLGLVLLAPYAAASGDAVPVSSRSASFTLRSAPARSAKAPQPDAAVKRAVFARVAASREVRHIADWVVDSGDNKGLPFVIVDKIDAKVFVFDAGGRIQGAAPALLGVARGDDTVPGIGDREYADMAPETRTTPAGRFVAALGMSTRGEDVSCGSTTTGPYRFTGSSLPSPRSVASSAWRPRRLGTTTSPTAASMYRSGSTRTW